MLYQTISKPSPSPIVQIRGESCRGTGQLPSAGFRFVANTEVNLARDSHPVSCQLLISPDCVFDASLVPETWRDWFVDSTGVISQVPEESDYR
jgi:hypothetical protein